MRILLLIGFAGFPLWLVILLFLYAQIQMSADLTFIALWALVPAIPGTIITTLITMAAVAIHSSVNGDKKRKDKIAGRFISLSFLVLAVAVATPFWMKHQKDNSIKIERPLIIQYAKENTQIHELVGIPINVSISSETNPNDFHSMPLAYEVRVEGTKVIYAIIKVNRNNVPATIFIECTTMLSSGQREASKEPCEQ
jgi:hypothetical protein